MNLPPPLDSLSDEEYRVLEGYMDTREFEAGHCIFKVGSPGDSCYIIDKGMVRIELDDHHTDDDGILAFLDAGMILGEMSLLDRLPRSASAYAHTEVTARRIDGRALDELGKTYPMLVYHIISALGRSASLKLRQTTERLDQMMVRKSDSFVDDMVERALEAQTTFMDWPEERIDALLRDIAQAVNDHAEELAIATVEESEIGNVPDKIIKNRIASLGIYQTLVGQKGQGTLNVDNDLHIVDIASPVGVVFGLIPVTNPVSTFVFKVLICIKSRNAVILGPSRRVIEVSNKVGQLIQAVLQDHDAPLDLVQWVHSRNCNRTTISFMNHRKMGLILATGGPALVKAAYSSGNPAIGVGPSNTPVLVCADANLEHAATSIIFSKAFDNGVICGAEHNLVVESSIRAAFIEALERHGAAVLTPEEAATFSAEMVDLSINNLKIKLIGQSAADLAQMVNIQRDYPIKVIVVPTTEGINAKNPYAHEKLFPVLSLITVADIDEGLDVCQALLKIEGAGHTAVIYSENPNHVARFGNEIPVSRLLVNSPGTHGIFGLTTGLIPSLTLPCGTFGGNSTTDNITYKHLLNIKRLAYYTPEREYMALAVQERQGNH